MELALYDPEAGYYARAAQRSGRAGDFFTSVDVGPVFGELLEIQLAEMANIVTTVNAEHAASTGKSQERSLDSASSAVSALNVVDLVEAAAGNGRLAADILTAAQRRDPAFYERVRLHLVEASSAARAAQEQVLGSAIACLASSSADLPASFEGVLLANELLDAMPVHQVVMRRGGLREIYVDGSQGELRTIEGPLSTPELPAYLNRLEVSLEPGWRVEINLRACEWIRTAARRLTRGFIIIIDYGHEARELYSASHSGGTLTTFARHTMAGTERPGDAPAWLEDAGNRDITSHVDFTSVRAAAESEGLTTVGFLDQTYFLIGLGAAGLDVSDLKKRLALKTLLMPGGLGSTHKVLILGKGVGAPALAGCSYRMRVT
jgi:SAM-dependent MidA family methyltransferase